MPLMLDETDIALLESLLKDGRKSFRQISREIKVSTPTVQKRYDRLINVGLIKAITIDLDLGKLESKTSTRLDSLRQKSIKGSKIKFDKGMLVKITCDYCKGQIHGKPSILKFANMERFLCCTSCKTLYKEKYKTRINALE
jgi:DNA-binding Lrp family transcriptional regulator